MEGGDAKLSMYVWMYGCMDVSMECSRKKWKTCCECVSLEINMGCVY